MKKLRHRKDHYLPSPQSHLIILVLGFESTEADSRALSRISQVPQPPGYPESFLTCLAFAGLSLPQPLIPQMLRSPLPTLAPNLSFNEEDAEATTSLMQLQVYVPEKQKGH